MTHHPKEIIFGTLLPVLTVSAVAASKLISEKLRQMQELENYTALNNANMETVYVECPFFLYAVNITDQKIASVGKRQSDGRVKWGSENFGGVPNFENLNDTLSRDIVDIATNRAAVFVRNMQNKGINLPEEVKTVGILVNDRDNTVYEAANGISYPTHGLTPIWPPKT